MVHIDLWIQWLCLMQLHNDRKKGFIPAGIVGATGGTSTGSYDNLDEIGDNS